MLQQMVQQQSLSNNSLEIRGSNFLHFLFLARSKKFGAISCARNARNARNPIVVIKVVLLNTKVVPKIF